MRDSMIFYRSFYEAIKELPVNDQVALYDAIFQFSLDFKEPELSGLPKTIFTLIRPNLEANNKRFKNGSKPKNKLNGSKTEAKPEQELSETEAKQKLSKSEAEANKDKDKDKDNNDNVDVDVDVDDEKKTPPSSSPKIKLSDSLFKGLDEEFAKSIQSAINNRSVIFFNKEIANKKNTYFQLVKNIPAFKETVKHLRLKETDETLEECEKRVDKALVDWLKEQTAGKIEHSWENILDIAQHALNYIRKQKKLTDERPKSHFGASTNKHTGAIETKSNDYSNSGW